MTLGWRAHVIRSPSLVLCKVTCLTESSPSVGVDKLSLREDSHDRCIPFKKCLIVSIIYKQDIYISQEQVYIYLECFILLVR